MFFSVHCIQDTKSFIRWFYQILSLNLLREPNSVHVAIISQSQDSPQVFDTPVCVLHHTAFQGALHMYYKKKLCAGSGLLSIQKMVCITL